ncbi:MAG: hypothetical protein PHX51_08600 [Clostridia bacterium]|nr:hypothetical protein [Clostridia bacterium]
MSEENINTAQAGPVLDTTPVKEKNEFKEQQDKINTILTSGRYILVTPDGNGIAVGMTPLEMARALKVFDISIFPTVISACVNDTMQKILAGYAAKETEKEAGTIAPERKEA